MAPSFDLDLALLSDPALRPIGEKVAAGQRLTTDDAAVLFRTPDLLGLGALADAANRAKHGKRVFFAANQHINPTNICILRKTCVFCSYARLPKEDGAYRYTMDQVYAEAAANPYVREFHEVSHRAHARRCRRGGVRGDYPLGPRGEDSAHHQLPHAGPRVRPQLHAQPVRGA